MITDKDIKLEQTFATKEALADLSVDVGEIKDTVAIMNEKMDHVLAHLDGIAGAIQELRTENGAGAVHLARHDLQIDALARETGIKIPV